METNLSAQIRNLMMFEVLWTGNAIKTVNTFGSEYCKLCEQERLYLISEMLGKSHCKLINKTDEIFGACRHKPSFHCYFRTTGISHTHFALMSDNEKEENINASNVENELVTEYRELELQEPIEYSGILNELTKNDERK